MKNRYTPFDTIIDERVDSFSEFPDLAQSVFEAFDSIINEMNKDIEESSPKPLSDKSSFGIDRFLKENEHYIKLVQEINDEKKQLESDYKDWLIEQTLTNVPEQFKNNVFNYIYERFDSFDENMANELSYINDTIFNTGLN
jgi:hypothetical protein